MVELPLTSCRALSISRSTQGLACLDQSVIGRAVIEVCTVIEVGADVVIIRGDGDIGAAFPTAWDDEAVVVVVVSAFAVV